MSKAIRKREKTMSELTDNNPVLSAEQLKESDERRKSFASMGIACIVYGVLFAILLFENYDAVTMPLWVLSTEGLILWAIRVNERELKRDSVFVMAAMTLIGISTFLTGNGYTIFLNYCAEFLMIVTLLIHNFASDGRWDFGTYLGRIIGSTLGAVAYVGSPFMDYGAYRKVRGEGSENARRIVRGLTIAIPCLLILGALLASADMVFSNIIGDMFEEIELDRAFRIVIMVMFGILSSYCGIRYVTKNIPLYEYREPRKGNPATAITVLACVLALYLVFSGIQIAYLFVGNFELPVGISYAEYARTGFFQLLAVCVIDLVSVLLIKKYSKASRVLDVMLLAIVACTAVMTASSAMRMLMYIGAYGLTYLRVMVLTALFAIAVLLVGVVIKILKEDFSFFRYGIAVIAVVYTVFALGRPDALIARYNIDHRDQIKLDTRYLANLSSDASDVIADYIANDAAHFNTYLAMSDNRPDELYLNSNWAERYVNNLRSESRRMGVRDFNLSRYSAGKLLEETISE